MTTEAMRASFEVWHSGNGNWPKSVEKDGNGNYRLAQAASAWHTFQAATAIERERAAKVCEEQARECLDGEAANSCECCADAIRNGETS